MVKWNIINLWIDDHNKPEIKPHSHNWNELIYYNKGKVLTNINGNNYEMNEGTFVIIPRKIKHDELRYGDTQTVCMIFTSNEEIEFEIFTDKSGEILTHLLTMNKEARAKLYKFKETLDYKLQELYILIERIRNSGKSFSKDFSYAINYINDNYRQKIDFAKLSKNLNMSYSNFRHQFKAVTGLPPNAFLIKKRIEESEKMLINGELNCTEIAYYCGFSTSAQFINLFKREKGITPNRYKKKNSKL